MATNDTQTRLILAKVSRYPPVLATEPSQRLLLIPEAARALLLDLLAHKWQAITRAGGGHMLRREIEEIWEWLGKETADLPAWNTEQHS